jgi:hypothetical protein
MPKQEDNREVESEDITRTGSANHGFGEEDLEEEITLEEEEDEDEDEDKSNSLLDD